jgi:hypothetical protein
MLVSGSLVNNWMAWTGVGKTWQSKVEEVRAELKAR